MNLDLPEPPATPWSAAEIETLRRLWPKQTGAQIAALLPTRSRSSVIAKARGLGLVTKPRGRKGNPNARVRKAYASKGDDVTLSRWVKVGKPNPPTQATLLHSPRVVSPAASARGFVAAGRSKFHAKGVRAPDALPHVLVSGHSNVKIGRDVRKGWARRYWLYTLTLEERATCPRTCHHWATCYGNNMPYASRVDHRDPAALQAAIAADVERLLAVKGRVGLMVRLHALGDFFDREYVGFWSLLLYAHPRLAVYGYTAWAPDSEIGAAIVGAKAAHGRRFAVRWSNGAGDTDCALPIQAVDQPVNAIVCPEQTGATTACATCGLCWGTPRNVAFIEH